MSACRRKMLFGMYKLTRLETCNGKGCSSYTPALNCNYLAGPPSCWQIAHMTKRQVLKQECNRGGGVETDKLRGSLFVSCFKVMTEASGCNVQLYGTVPWYRTVQLVLQSLQSAVLQTGVKGPIFMLQINGWLPCVTQWHA